MFRSRSAIRLRLVALPLVLALLLASTAAAASSRPEGDQLATIRLPAGAEVVAGGLTASARLAGARDAKLDSALAAVAGATQVSPAQGLASAAEQGLRLSGERVHVQVVVKPGSLQEATRAIEAAGGEVTKVGPRGELLQGWLPVSALARVVGVDSILYVRPAREAITLEGSLTTEGVAAMGAAAWHSAGDRGAGVKVAIVDAGFQGYAGLLGTDLPAAVTVKNFVDGETDPQVDGTTAHGTACAEIVHDVAPDAQLYLVKINTDLDLSDAVAWLQAQQVDVISTSLTWYSATPGDGTGFFADLVSQARANGILWVTAAGNDREAHWGGAFSDADADGAHNFNGDQEIDYFGPGNGDAYLINPGYVIRVFLRWDDWTTVDQDYDLYLVRWDGANWVQVAASQNPQTGVAGQRPTEYVAYTSSGAAAPYGFVITRYNATRSVNFEAFAIKIARLDELVYARSLGNLADSPAAVTVAALDVNSPYPQESYSSEGPTNGPGGTASGGAVKPDISAFANVSTVSYGTTNKFNGTSSATPHVAGAAALVLSAYPALTPDQTRSFLQERAVDMGAAGKDNQFGFGRLNLGTPPAPGAYRIYLPFVARN